MSADGPESTRESMRAAMPAARLAELRRERAERLVRLRGAGDAVPDAPGAAAEDGEPALAAFLRALRAAIEDSPPLAAAVDSPRPVMIGDAPPAAAVLPFQRAPGRPAERPAEPQAEPAPGPAAAPGDLDRLPGAGPGLVWALEQAGIARLADLAAQAPAPLADRLGPVGGLIDLPGWIAFAKSAAKSAAGAAAESGTAAPPG